MLLRTQHCSFHTLFNEILRGSLSVCLSVCLFVCLSFRYYVWKTRPNFTKFLPNYPRLWLGPPTAVQYIIYFRFYWWHNVGNRTGSSFVHFVGGGTGDEVCRLRLHLVFVEWFLLGWPHIFLCCRMVRGARSRWRSEVDALSRLDHPLLPHCGRVLGD